jgi:RNA polymerase sigma factor (sigma-70 family)
MVWGVCRRQLGHCHDAEDAFQAAFQALAHNAGAISARGALAGWLYRVALHASLALRKRRNRRDRREHLMACLPERPAGDDPAHEAGCQELERILDEEIRLLPDRLRVPFLLCALQGRSRAAVAAELCCPVGTVESRLCRARQRLRTRLVRRGLTLPALLVSAVPAALRAATYRLTSAPSVPRHIAGLAREAAKAGTYAHPARALVACLLTACFGWLALAAGPAATTPEQASTLPPARETSRSVEPPLPAGAVARIGSTRLRHGGQVTSVAFSADGKWIATADEETACVWDTATGKLRHCWPGRKTWGRPVAFSADGKALLTLGAGKDKAPEAWLYALDLATGKERPPKTAAAGRPDARFLAALAADGKLFGCQDGEEYRIHDAATERLIRKVPLPPTGWMAPVFSLGGKALALASGKQAVKVFDVGTGKELCTIKEEKSEISATAFSADARVLGTITNDRTAAWWDVTTGRLLRRIGGLERTASCLAFSPDGKRLAVGNLQRLSVQLFDVTTGKELRRFRSWPSVKQVVFSPDGKSLAAGRSIGTVSVWDPETGRPRPCSAHPDNGAFTLRFTDQGLLVIDSEVAVYDWKTGRRVRGFADVREIPWAGFALSHDGRLEARSELDGGVRLYEASTGKLLRTLKGGGFADKLVFSPDGRRLFARGLDATVPIWDVKEGKLLHKFQAGSNRSGGRLAVSPDGKLLALSAFEGGAQVVRVWDVLRGKQLHRWTSATGALVALAFAPDSSLLATVGARREKGEEGSGTIVLWDMQTGTARREIAVDGLLYSVAFSADGRTLATGGRTIRLWEVATGKERHNISGHKDATYTLAFSRDGRHLASASSEAPVFVWDVYGLSGKKRPAAGKLADELASADAAVGFDAVCRLAARGEEAVALCRQLLRPAPPPDEKRFRKLLTELDSSRFSARQRASEELEKLAEEVEPLVRKALREAPALETKKRLEQVLARLKEPGPERRRQLRALEVLELVATPAARELLNELAGGAPGAWLTRAAAAARDRLRRR